jgi:MFS family permease
MVKISYPHCYRARNHMSARRARSYPGRFYCRRARSKPLLAFSASDIGLAASFYLTGAIIGALGFAWLTDRLGRRIRWRF